MILKPPFPAVSTAAIEKKGGSQPPRHLYSLINNQKNKNTLPTEESRAFLYPRCDRFRNFLNHAGISTTNLNHHISGHNMATAIAKNHR